MVHRPAGDRRVFLRHGDVAAVYARDRGVATVEGHQQIAIRIDRQVVEAGLHQFAAPECQIQKFGTGLEDRREAAVIDADTGEPVTSRERRSVQR